MKIHEIRELIKLIDQSTINEFEYEENGAIVKMKKGVDAQVVSTFVPAPALQQEIISQPSVTSVATIEKITEVPKAVEEVAKVEDTNLHKITSPMVGTFYSSPSPDTASYVNAGDKVNESSIVCIVEAMKLFNEIEAEVQGEIVEVLVKDGQLVEFGQPLFLVKA
jgi:acetyl-CoA carboxylase biotin carboxyl carrier protein